MEKSNSGFFSLSFSELNPTFQISILFSNTVLIIGILTNCSITVTFGFTFGNSRSAELRIYSSLRFLKASLSVLYSKEYWLPLCNKTIKVIRKK